jgi:hypothetical protein
MSSLMRPVRHTVLCKFRSDVALQNRISFFEQIRRLNEIPGIAFTNFQSGANVSPEGHAKGFTDAFAMDFESREACFAYLAHPTHQAIGERLIEALDGGANGLIVFDMDLDAYENATRKAGPVLDKHRNPRPSRAARAYD